jgi:hypothetical protein
MADERTKVLDQVAEQFEARAAELDEFYRRFGHLGRYDGATLQAKADGFREAAVMARATGAAIKPAKRQARKGPLRALEAPQREEAAQ